MGERREVQRGDVRLAAVLTPRRTVVLATAAVATIMLSLPAASEPRPDAVNVKVAVRGDGACGAFADQLPPLVTASDVQPGSTGPVAVVCVSNVSKAKGRLSLSVIDLAGQDGACTGNEGDVDPTCGGGLAGELDELLVQDVGLLPRCGSSRTTAFDARPLASLQTAPFDLGVLRGGATICVALRVAYPAVSPDAAAAAQTDDATWRYAFDLTG